MMLDHIEFLEQSVRPMEELLLQHPLAELFTGKLFADVDEQFTGLELPDFGDAPLSLSPMEVGRLFMAPDASIVKVLRLGEQADGSPAGFNVSSDNPFVQLGQPVEVIAYQGENGNAIQVNNLHVRTIVLDRGAPERLCTLAFGLMAVTAYRLKFREITLFAAGRGPITPDDPDEFVGFMVWPKFGFDAQLDQVDLQAAPHLRQCQSVLDIMNVDPDWWANHGSGREMSFDLRPNSRSWLILLNYLCAVLEG